jgi:hypothetical protein
MPTVYINNCVSPFIYAEGTTTAPLVGYVPPTGIPEVPISLNQTFVIDFGSVFVPQIGQNGMNINNAWRVTFLNPGSGNSKKVMIVSNGFGNDTINEGYEFFNTIKEGPTDVITDGVFIITTGGTISSGRKKLLNSPKPMLLSTRGVFTVNRARFPYSGPNNPRPDSNYNGIQDGSLITFHTNDWYGIYTFDQPQDIRAQLNILPEPQG